MIESIGIGKGTVSIDDFHKAEAIFILGQNPGTNHPRMLAELEKASRRGATIVSFNPLKEAGLLKFTHPQDPLAMVLNQKTNISTHYLQPRIGGDMATLRAMAKIILARQDLEGDIVDSAFIQEHCSEYEKYRACVAEESWEDLLEQSGLLREQIEEVTQVYIESKSVIICWAMGITQHRHGVASVQEIINLLLLKGNIGRPGAGACPIRGHSNVQGDRTVGITEYPEESFLGKLDKAFNIHAPREHGLGAVQAIKAMHLETAKFFFGLGGNFAAATPDTSYTYEALKKCSMTVHVSTHLNRSHVIHGKKALILPCLGRTEMDHQASGPQFITVEDSMSRVHASKGVHRPASPALKSEPAIVAELALRLFPHSHIPWQAMCDDYAIIRSKMEAVLPHFENYQQRVAKPKGFYLPNSAGLRQWKTLTKKARFMSNTLPQIKIEPGHLRLMTMRSHNQYNTTIYNHHDRYRGIENERCVILLNGEDIAERGLKEGQRVNIKSHAKDGIERMVKDFMIIVYNIPRGNAATYFPEANPLIGIDEIADRSHTPMSKFIEISLIA